MTQATNVPEPTFGATGFVAPAESAILAGFFQDMNAAFGGNLNVANLFTPQAQVASSETAILASVFDMFVFLTNMFDPAFSFGRYQDALARIYFIERNPSQPTVCQCVCTGLAGVVIPVGATATAVDGNTYICQSQGTIATTGSVTLSFACKIPGPIACPAGTLNAIYQTIPGWDTINNPADGILGRNTETRADFEQRRGLSVAHNSIGALPSVLGAVLSVPNVVDAYVVENTASVVQTIGNVLVNPNSIYVSVAGGDPNAVAYAIWSRKAPGCGYNGNTIVAVQDDQSGYSAPFPTYRVAFTIPSSLEIQFSITIVNSPQIPPDIFDGSSLTGGGRYEIQQAIIGAFAGLDGGPRARIGTAQYASRYYAPVAALGAWAAQIVSIEIGTVTPTGFVVPVAINQFPTTAPANITVVYQ